MKKKTQARGTQSHNKLQLEWGKIVIPPTITIFGGIIVALFGCAGTIVAALISLGIPNAKPTQIPTTTNTIPVSATFTLTPSITPTVQTATPTKVPPLIIQEWEGDESINNSAFGCYYAWPKSETHEVRGNGASLYYQKNTWSLHSSQDIYLSTCYGDYIPGTKLASPAYVLLASDNILLKQISLHLIRFEPPPKTDDFIFAMVADRCGTGGGMPPQLDFENLVVTPNDTIFFL